MMHTTWPVEPQDSLVSALLEVANMSEEEFVATRAAGDESTCSVEELVHSPAASLDEPGPREKALIRIAKDRNVDITPETARAIILHREGLADLTDQYMREICTHSGGKYAAEIIGFLYLCHRVNFKVTPERFVQVLAHAEYAATIGLAILDWCVMAETAMTSGHFDVLCARAACTPKIAQALGAYKTAASCFSDEIDIDSSYFTLTDAHFEALCNHAEHAAGIPAAIGAWRKAGLVMTDAHFGALCNHAEHAVGIVAAIIACREAGLALTGTHFPNKDMPTSHHGTGLVLTDARFDVLCSHAEHAAGIAALLQMRQIAELPVTEEHYAAACTQGAHAAGIAALLQACLNVKLPMDEAHYAAACALGAHASSVATMFDWVRTQDILVDERVYTRVCHMMQQPQKAVALALFSTLLAAYQVAGLEVDTSLWELLVRMSQTGVELDFGMAANGLAGMAVVASALEAQANPASHFLLALLYAGRLWGEFSVALCGADKEKYLQSPEEGMLAIHEQMDWQQELEPFGETIEKTGGAGRHASRIYDLEQAEAYLQKIPEDSPYAAAAKVLRWQLSFASSDYNEKARRQCRTHLALAVWGSPFKGHLPAKIVCRDWRAVGEDRGTCMVSEALYRQGESRWSHWASADAGEGPNGIQVAHEKAELDAAAGNSAMPTIN